MYTSYTSFKDNLMTTKPMKRMKRCTKDKYQRREEVQPTTTQRKGMESRRAIIGENTDWKKENQNERDVDGVSIRREREAGGKLTVIKTRTRQQWINCLNNCLSAIKDARRKGSS